jgi:chloride channel protein, CIC family
VRPTVNGARLTSSNPQPIETNGSAGNPYVHVGTILIAAAVAVIAGLLALAYREAIFFVIRLVSGTSAATTAFAGKPKWLAAGVVAGGLLVASGLGRKRQSPGAWLGLRAITLGLKREESTRAQGRENNLSDDRSSGLDLAETTMRSSATFVASACVASLGREAAILELGASVGTFGANRFKRNVVDLSIAGAAAAFAVAYHAPIAASLYIFEHVLGSSREHRLWGTARRRRAMFFAFAGSVVGMALSLAFRHHAVFRRANHPLTVASLLRACLVAVPALLVVAILPLFRKHILQFRYASNRLVMLLCALMAGFIVAFRPLAAGNGMEGIQTAFSDLSSSANGQLGTPLVQIGVTLLIWKLLATVFALGSGAPGGIFSPSMAIGAGVAISLMKVTGAPAAVVWDAMLAAMAVGIFAATGAPLMAIVATAELSGDIRILPAATIAVAISVVVQRVFALSWPPQASAAPRRFSRYRLRGDLTLFNSLGRLSLCRIKRQRSRES